MYSHGFGHFVSNMTTYIPVGWAFLVVLFLVGITSQQLTKCISEINLLIHLYFTEIISPGHGTLTTGQPVLLLITYPGTVPCRIVLARAGDRVTWPYHRAPQTDKSKHSFSFSSRWYRSARKGPYALRPVSQQSPQGCCCRDYVD